MALGGGRNGVTNPGDTVIGTGSTVEGVMEIESRLHVDGTLRGRLTTPDRLVVGEEGSIIADSVEVGEAVINGRVMARLKAVTRVHLTATARFRGTVEPPFLVIEEGAEMMYSTEEIPVQAIPFGSGNAAAGPVMTTVAEFPSQAERDASKSTKVETTPESELAGD